MLNFIVILAMMSLGVYMIFMMYEQALDLEYFRSSKIQNIFLSILLSLIPFLAGIISGIEIGENRFKEKRIKNTSKQCIENQCPYEQHIIYNENKEPVDTVYRKRKDQ